MLRVLGNTWGLDKYTRGIRNLYHHGYLRPFEVSDLNDDNEHLLTARFIPDSRVFLDAKFYPNEAEREATNDTGYTFKGETLEEKASNLLSSYKSGAISRQTYRRLWPRLLGSSIPTDK